MGHAVPAKVCEACTVTEAVIERCFFDHGIRGRWLRGIWKLLVWNGNGDLEVIETWVQVRVAWRMSLFGGLHGPREVCLDLSESRSESIEGGVHFVLFVVADTEDSGKW